MVDQISTIEGERCLITTDFRNGAKDVLRRQIDAPPSRIDMHDLPPRTYVNALVQGVLVRLCVATEPQGS
ncbi:hypothetical protein [Streptomyces sp. LUP30]|uniref:hypothetical protein n=1 Tax=Streptomyces sp. LUP30 TaxID=1890285 RepID=UPI0008517FF3|nr:hypothetical protein [Streptomyces sp. LUP30]